MSRFVEQPENVDTFVTVTAAPKKVLRDGPPDEPRDDQGRWTDDGGDSSGKLTDDYSQTTEISGWGTTGLEGFDKKDEKALNKIKKLYADVYGQMIADIPGLKKHLENAEISLTLKNASAAREANKRCGGTCEELEDGGNEIVIATKSNFFKKENAELTTGGGFHNVDNSAAGVLRHEVGHAVYNSLPKSAQNKWIDGYIDPDFGTRDISEYARTNYKELFAEAFAAYTHPDYYEHLPPKIETLLKKQIGKRRDA